MYMYTCITHPQTPHGDLGMDLDVLYMYTCNDVQLSVLLSLPSSLHPSLPPSLHPSLPPSLPLSLYPSLPHSRRRGCWQPTLVTAGCPALSYREELACSTSSAPSRSELHLSQGQFHTCTSTCTCSYMYIKAYLVFAAKGVVVHNVLTSTCTCTA